MGASCDETTRDFAPRSIACPREADILRIISDPDTRFTIAPEGVMVYADFMHRVGLIKTKPVTWKDVFVVEAHGFPGN